MPERLRYGRSDSWDSLPLVSDKDKIPMKTVNVVAAVIRRADGCTFATQRGYGEWKDWWEFPGGKVEPGEDPPSALRREIREELDTEIRVGERLCHVEYDYPHFHLSMDCYLCEVVTGKLTLLEHEAARWLKPDEMDQVHWLPADLQVVCKLALREKTAPSA